MSAAGGLAKYLHHLTLWVVSRQNYIFKYIIKNYEVFVLQSQHYSLIKYAECHIRLHL